MLVAFTLFRPGFWLDRVVAPYEIFEPTEIFEVVDSMGPGEVLTIVVGGPDFDTGERATTTILVSLDPGDDANDRLSNAGLLIDLQSQFAVIEEPFPGTPFFESIGKSFDYYGEQPVHIAEVKKKAKRIAKEVFYLPATCLFLLVLVSQRRRMRRST